MHKFASMPCTLIGVWAEQTLYFIHATFYFIHETGRGGVWDFAAGGK